MAERPVFLCDEEKYMTVKHVEFDYYGGFAKSQRQKCVKSLHRSFLQRYPERKVLEISSFSENETGIGLSAFQLMITGKNGKRIPVESAYQAGKVFELGGPYTDLLEAAPAQAKRDERLKTSGRITAFEFDGMRFPTEPLSLFYTWLYLRALTENEELGDQLMEYDAFTDIVFNPNKSVSCQACSAAVYVSLRKKGELERAVSDPEFLAGILPAGSRASLAEQTAVQAASRKPKAAQKPVVVSRPEKKPAEPETPFFEVGDAIVHPSFGSGIITATKESRGRINLVIKFEGREEEMLLYEGWVKEHCSYSRR